MRKHTLVTLAVIALLALGGITFGVGRMQASAHVQVSATQTQLNNQHANSVQGIQVKGTENDPPDTGETTGSGEDQGQDQNLPGGGHQDQGPSVDHQFEGTE